MERILLPKHDNNQHETAEPDSRQPSVDAAVTQKQFSLSGKLMEMFACAALRLHPDRRLRGGQGSGVLLRDSCDVSKTAFYQDLSA